MVRREEVSTGGPAGAGQGGKGGGGEGWRRSKGWEEKKQKGTWTLESSRPSHASCLGQSAATISPLGRKQGQFMSVVEGEDVEMVGTRQVFRTYSFVSFLGTLKDLQRQASLTHVTRKSNSQLGLTRFYRLSAHHLNVTGQFIHSKLTPACLEHPKQREALRPVSGHTELPSIFLPYDVGKRRANSNIMSADMMTEDSLYISGSQPWLQISVTGELVRCD